MRDSLLGVVFVSNGPGELATWVRPLADTLHGRLLMRPRVSSSAISLHLVLVPCPNATGKEAEVANGWNQFEHIQPASLFWDLLIRPSSYVDLPKKGLVVFLGGDQFWSVLLSARLGYRHLTYAEWVARWPGWNDRIAAMSPAVRERLPKRLRGRCKVVGDLMADLACLARSKEPLPKGEWVALLPGSKRAKLKVGVPFLLEVADRLSQLRPGCRFFLPVAATTTLEEIRILSSPCNPISKKYSSSVAAISASQDDCRWYALVTNSGTEITLQEEQPAHGFLSQCDLALTTVGANTAELGALGVPMIVILPTQHLAVMQAWDGILGIFGRLPFLRWCIGLLLSGWHLRKRNFWAWPNISAGRMIVPERVGKIFPKEIAEEAAEWLASPQRLEGLREDLRGLRGKPGAVEMLAKEIEDLLKRA